MTALATLLAHQPQSTAAETAARATFQALLNALSNPGRVFTLPGSLPTTQANCAQIGLTLLDLETSFYTADPLLRRAFKPSGAPFMTASNAAYLFFPSTEAFEPMMLRQTLDILECASVGTITDPDLGATVVVAGRIGEGLALHLHGPGIQGETALYVDGLPIAFWHLRAAKITYPLGIDLFLVDGDQVVGLPRTTVIEII